MKNNRFKMIVRAWRTIKSCKTPAQIENAMVYKDLVLDTVYPDKNSLRRQKWNDKLLARLNAKALEVCGVVEED
jgi:hypothetical protein